MRLTANQAAQEIQKQFGGELMPEWRMRRVIDALAASLTIELIGRYRTIPSEELPIVATELQPMELIPRELAAAS
jgi:hypothetical protein